ncbi:MAG: dTMP kinase [Erysipelotrichaceae bacterium]
MKKGWFITFEGPDGSGKTTVSKAVFEKLKEMNIACLYTREPGGSKIAEKIRDIILNPEHTSMDAKTEALLYAASRRQHLVEKVLPAIEEGKVVICDRFIDSSLAYQGYGRAIGFDEVLSINQFAIENYFPEKTIFLALDEAEGLKRIQSRTFKDRLDQESLDFHHEVSQGYQAVLKKFEDRMVVVDASQEVEQVIEDALKKILAIIHG